MSCKKRVPERDPHGLPYMHARCAKFLREETHEKRRSDGDPERIISEYGATELSKTVEGRKVIERAARKYKAELVQPGHPEFEKLYGRQVREREEHRRENERIARDMWRERGASV